MRGGRLKVLLAVDASPDSRQAAQVIRQLAEPPDLDVLNVVDLDALKHAFISPTLPAGYYEEYRKEVSEVAERVLHEMRTQLAPDARQLRLIADSGDAAESIIQTAEESRSQLIVVGQRGMTATPTFLLGGVTQKVATYAPCSVLVVKGSLAALDRILLAVDGSNESNKAFRLLSQAPFKTPLHVTIVTVWPTQTVAGLGHVWPGKNQGETTEAAKVVGDDLVRKFAATLRDGPYEVDTECLYGDPAFAILDAATRHDAQMIVVGARGLKAIKRFLLGSVSQKLLVHSACSVLIVR